MGQDIATGRSNVAAGRFIIIIFDFYIKKHFFNMFVMAKGSNTKALKNKKTKKNY